MQNEALTSSTSMESVSQLYGSGTVNDLTN